MFDAKILAAVLASLAAVAVSMNGGTVDPQISDFPADKTSTGVSDFLPEPLEKVRDALVSRPDPSNSVNAELVVESLEDERLKVKKTSIELENLTSVDLRSNRLSSDETVSFHNFEGSIKPGEKSQINGRAGSVTTSGVNVSGGISIVQEIESERIVLEGVEKSAIRFSTVKGEIDSGDQVIKLSNSTKSLKINSFSGDIVIRPGNNTVKLDGKVDRLEAGSFSFGN